MIRSGLILFLARIAHAVELCDQYDAYTVLSGNYTYNSDQWGADGSGHQCIDFSKTATVPSFSVTWSWADSPEAVHAYPHVARNTSLLPLRLSELTYLRLKAEWSMYPHKSHYRKNVVDTKGLNKIAARANVALDSFLDSSSTLSQNSTGGAEYELMIWLGTAGQVAPVGDAGTVYATIAGHKFVLYSGRNANDRMVFSWLPSSNESITSFDADVSPLFQSLVTHKLISGDLYVGVLQFGSECFHADKEVTFSVQHAIMELEKGSAVEDSSDSSSSSTDARQARMLGAAGVLLLVAIWVI